MKYCTIEELQPGMVLGRPIYGHKGLLLLANGQSLDNGFINRLDELGFLGAYVDVPGFENVDPSEVISASLRAGTHLLLDDCLERLTELSPSIQGFDLSLDSSLEDHPEIKRAISLSEFQKLVGDVIDELSSQLTFELPCLLLKTQSQYQVQHATDTMLLSVLLGIRFSFIYRELKQLGLAALLHDVGKTLLAEPGQKNIGPDHPKYKDHPHVGGLIMLESSNNHYIECAAIQQHHERQDGKGFPEGLTGFNKAPSPGSAYQRGSIYRLAEIISVADAYDVLTSGIYQPALSPELALENLIKRSFFEFNTHVVNMLAQIVQIFPVGCTVKIVRCSNPKLQNNQGIVQTADSEHPHQVDIILTRDIRGNALKPSLISLADDDSAKLDLVL